VAPLACDKREAALAEIDKNKNQGGTYVIVMKDQRRHGHARNDGRYSRARRAQGRRLSRNAYRPAVFTAPRHGLMAGHVAPEAEQGGPIALSPTATNRSTFRVHL